MYLVFAETEFFPQNSVSKVIHFGPVLANNSCPHHPPPTAAHHQTGPSETLPRELFIVRIAIAEPHEAAARVRLVDVRSVDSVVAETYHVSPVWRVQRRNLPACTGR